MANVNAPNTVSFGNPATIIAPDLMAQQLQLQRQQQWADALRAQAMTPIESQTVTGAGPARVVPISPLQGVAKLLSAYLGGKQQQDIDQKNMEIAQMLRQRYDALMPGQKSDAQSVSTNIPASMPENNPDSLPISQAQTSPVDIGQSDSRQNMPGNVPISNQSLPQRSTVSQQPQAQSNSPFSLADLVRGGIAEQVGGTPAANAYWEQLKPTELIKNNNYMGITPEQARQFQLAKLMKEGTQEFTGGKIVVLPNGQKMVLPNFETGVAGGFDVNGNPLAMEIPGAAAIAANRAAAVAGATKSAELPFQMPSVVDTQEGPRLMTPAQQIGAANGGGAATPIKPLPTPLNNPGNIRPIGSSTGFQQFTTPAEGLAAIDKNLQAYGSKGINTISSIISRWAPPNENNTNAYIQDVAKRLGVNPNQPLDMGNPIVRQALSTAITLHEQGPSNVFSSASNGVTPGLALQTPEQKKVNEEKGAAAINAAKVEESAAPLFAAINDARKLVGNLPYGSSTPIEEWAANQKYLVGNPEKAAAIAQWNNLMGNFTMNGIASSGLGRMDIPIVNAINKASNVPMEASPAAKLAALDQIEANLKRHVASLKNVVPNLNQPGITQNTATLPMAPVNNAFPSMDAINAEIARRAALRGK